MNSLRLKFTGIVFASLFCGMANTATALGAEKTAVKNPVAPRRPTIPAAGDTGLTNPIDLFLQPYLAEHKIKTGAIVADEVFARRVYLDLIGLLPPTEQLNAFLNDQRPDKRRLLVRRLLDDRRAYAEHWMTFWNDALRNAYRGTGFIDDGRSQITGWLFQALYENKPFHQFVHELISPVDGSAGFIKGIVWRGVVNASQRRELQAAQTISQVFMGTNLKCASCHDNFLNDWKLSDAYGLANVFADKPLETYRCNKPNGEFAPVKFLYPQFGAIDAKAPRAVRIKQLADAITNPENGRLTRTMVNRLWAIFFGHGLIDPVDEMGETPWNADLLDWLAADFADHGNDLKHTMELICTSRAYQLAAVGSPKPGEDDYVFHGPFVKRMSGEQFLDAVSSLTGVWQPASGPIMKRDGRGQGGQLWATAGVLAELHREDYPITTHWIWNDPQAAQGTGDGSLYLRRVIQLAAAPSKARVVAACDNEFELFVNGKKVAAGSNWERPGVIDLTGHLHAGANTIAAHAINHPDKKSDKKEKAKSLNPAGFVLHGELHFGGNRKVLLGTSAEWICTTEEHPGWEQENFSPKDWQHAVEVADANGGPWKINNTIVAALIIDKSKIRAALAMDDNLTRALGRSNREQVVTRRDSIATTLQALELTNGGTLDAILRRGANKWLEQNSADPDQITRGIYRQALGRAATANELATARDLAGSPATVTGVQDLLWVVMMMPEFQLID